MSKLINSNWRTVAIVIDYSIFSISQLNVDSNISEKEISFEQVSEGSLESDTDGQDQIETDADDEVKDGEDDEENEVCKYISVSGIEKKISSNGTTPFKLGPDQ